MKTKLLLMMCLVGALCFSCNDDNDDRIKLVAGELNISEAKAGDELIISGEGFSTIKEENIVRLNDLVISVTGATASQLKLVIPAEATTGTLTVTLDNQMLDYGTFKVLQEKILTLKLDYDNGGDYIVSIDPKTGLETPFIELPKIDHDNLDLMYSSLCYLGDSKEVLVMQHPEWPVDKYKILKINIETKELVEYDFVEVDELEDIEMTSDGKSTIYFIKDLYWSEEDGNTVTFEKVNLESKELELIATSKGELIYDCNVSIEKNRIYYLRENETEDDSTLEYLSLNDKSLNEVALNSSEILNNLMLDSSGNLYALSSPSKEKYNLVKINVEDRTEDLVMNFPDGEEGYSNLCFSIVSNEFIFFLDGDNDTTESILKANLTDKTISTVDYEAETSFYFSYPVSIFQ